ncbi:MAG: 2-hydroxyacyl-CoA dehydratase [Syntrophobacteraceae bacterium]
MTQKAIEKYEYLHRVVAICDLLEMAVDTGATTPQELAPHIPGLLEQATEYHASILARAQPELVEAVLKPKNSQAIKTFAGALRDYVTGVADGIDQGKPLIHYFVAVPCEIFYAMDVVGIMTELWTLLIPAVLNEGVEPELDYSEIEGLPSHLCGFQRAPFAALQKGLLPKPLMFVKTTAPCDSSNITMQYAAYKFNIPLYAVDSPYYTNRRAFRYFLDEFKRMIETIEKTTGHTLDEDKLRSRVESSNVFMDYTFKLEALRKNVPNPDPGMHRLLDRAALEICGSTEKLIDYGRKIYEEALARHEKGETFLPEGKREIRTLWTGSTFPYALYIADWVEEQFGSTYIDCSLSHAPGEVIGLVNTTSVESMIEGLAWRMFNAPMHRNVMSHTDVHLNDMLAIAKSHGAHAAVYAGHQGCKHSWTLPKLLSDLFQSELGIPSLTFEVDWVDKRFTPPQVVMNHLREFFEILG